MQTKPTIQGVIAVDGPAGAGKSTAAQGLAQALGAVRLDTGAIYRSVALHAKNQGVDWEDGPALGRLAAELDLRFEVGREPQGVLLAGQDVTEAIRTPEMSRGASAVSKHPEVRDALHDLQRRLAAKGLVVAEGRDMGTVVFPDALVKIYLTASDEERARRRFRELQEKGVDQSLEAVLAEQRERDRQDRSRETAPLRQAEDAVVVDSSSMTLDEVVAAMVRLVDRVRLERRLREAEAELKDREDALPAHSIRPHQLLEIEELEDEVDQIRTELASLSKDQA